MIEALLPDHVIARVHGDAVPFLHATLSQDLEHLAPGSGALACLLDEKAHVLGVLRVLALAGGDASIDGEHASEAVEYLARVAPLSGCEVEVLEWNVRAVRGETDLSEHEHRDVDGVIHAGVEWGGGGHDELGPDRVAEGSFDAVDALRIADGRPRYGVDVTTDMYVYETPYLSRAVSFTKGCYPGQESVARVTNLGRARRALVGLELRAPATAGDTVVVEGREVGRLTSVAGSHAIAHVHAATLDAADVSVGGAAAVVRVLR